MESTNEHQHLEKSSKVDMSSERILLRSKGKISGSQDKVEQIPSREQSDNNVTEQKKCGQFFAPKKSSIVFEDEKISAISEPSCCAKNNDDKKTITHFRNKYITLTEDRFGSFYQKDNTEIEIQKFTWLNHNGIEVQIITYGARIISMKMPNKAGAVEDIVLGFDDLASYIQYDLFLGATIGRMTGIVENATFVIDGQQYWITANKELHHVNGGIQGLDKVIWQPVVTGTNVTLTYVIPDNHEGFPGDVIVNISYKLSSKNEFKINMEAKSSKSTIINLSNLCYFNLAGHNAGNEELYKHIVTINSNSYTSYGEDDLPSGEITNVAFTKYDFQMPTILKKRMRPYLNDGFDQNFCINRESEDDICFVARALHIPSGRTLEIYSNQSGVRFTTANEFVSLFMRKASADLKIKLDKKSLLLTQLNYESLSDPSLSNISEQEEVFIIMVNIYQEMKAIHSVDENNFIAFLDLLKRIYSCNLENIEALFINRTLFKEANIDIQFVITSVIETIRQIQHRIPSNIYNVNQWDDIKDYVENILNTFHSLDATIKGFTKELNETCSKKKMNEEELQKLVTVIQKKFLLEATSGVTDKQRSQHYSNSINNLESVSSDAYSITEGWMKQELHQQMLKSVTERVSKINNLAVSKANASIPSSAFTSKLSIKNTSKLFANLPKIKGKNNAEYAMHSAMAFQTQNYPNAIYHKNFPNCILRPNETYKHTIIYKFWVQSGCPKKWIRRNCT